MKKLLFLPLLFLASAANAAMIFVGSFNVYDGPYWENTPPVYSAREAAALIFGGSYTDYAVSIDSSLEASTITHTAYYSGYGDYGDDLIFNEDFKLDLSGGGYGFGGVPFSAYSAYVSDEVNALNYVWKHADAVTPISEPASHALLFAGLALVSLVTRRRSKGKGATSI